MHYAGDAVLAKFEAVVDALSCAAEVQRQIRLNNADLSEPRKLRFRIGVNLGDVIEDRNDIYGDGVNIAARLESLAEPGGPCISDAVRTAVGKNLPFQYSFIGEQRVKNIHEPVRAYRVFDRADDSASKTPAGIPPPLPALAKPSIAIKPFENISDDPGQDYFADGLSWDLDFALIRIPALYVIEGTPRNRDPKQMTVHEYGSMLGVRYVLTGGVRKSADRIRVNAELVEVETGRKIRGERYDGDLVDLFKIQDEITEHIVTAMEVKLVGGEQVRYARHEIRNPQARDHLYRGELLMYSDRIHDIREAQQHYEEVSRLEPESSLGCALAAMTYWWEAFRRLSDTPTKALDRAVELAHQSLRNNDTSGYPHLVLAHAHLQKREFDAALAQASLSVTPRPSCSGAYSLKASILIYLGDPCEAIELAEYAVRLIPINPAIYSAVLASSYRGCGRYADAISAARSTLELNETSVDPCLVLAAAHAELGNHDEACAAAQKLQQLQPGFNLQDFADSQPYREQKDPDRLINQLGKAGLP